MIWWYPWQKQDNNQDEDCIKISDCYPCEGQPALWTQGRVRHQRHLAATRPLQTRYNPNINIINIIITITRPKPAYGRQGLAGSWGQDTDEVSTFLVFLTSHFAPVALSSDLTNLGPLMTMKIHLETLKNNGNQAKTMKTMKPPWKTMETKQKPWNHLEKP